MIRFLSVSFVNFLCFQERTTVPLDGQGVVLLEGENWDDPGADSNMSGKTSILDAIVWGLYGWTIRYGRDSDAVVNRFSGTGCRVSVAFEIRDTHWKVHRFRKHGKYENHVFLEREGKNISADRDEDTQAMVEDLLGIGYEPFIHCVLFGGAEPFAQLTDSQQKKILESFLGFEKFDLALQRTRREKTELTERLDHLKSKHASAREKLAEARANWSSAMREAESYKQAAGSRIADLEALLTEAKEKIAGVSFVSIETAREEVREASKILEDKQKKAAAEQAKYSTALQLYNHALNLATTGKCPTCGQATTDIAKPPKPGKIFLADAHREFESAATALENCKLTLRDAEILEQMQRQVCEIEDRIRQEKSLTPEVDEDTPALEFSRAAFREIRLRLKGYDLVSKLRDLEFWEEGFGSAGIKTVIVKRSLPVLNARVKEIAGQLLNGTLEFAAQKTLKSGAERNLFHIEYVAKAGANRYDGESAGGKRRVDICILLCFSWFSRVCNLLLVDELLDSLDESGREIALRILSDLRPTVLVISHRKDVRGADQKWIVQKKNGSSRLLTQSRSSGPATSVKAP